MRVIARRTTSSLALALGLVACSTTPQSTEETFETYANAMGSADIDTLMSLYTDNAQWTVDDQVIAVGRDNFRDSHNYEVGLGAQREFHQWHVEGNRVVAHSTESSEFFRLFGIETLQGVTVFEFENGRIASVQTKRDLEQLGQAEPELVAFFGWLQEAHPDFCAGLFQDGVFDGDGEEGMHLIGLARLWCDQQAMKSDIDPERNRRSETGSTENETSEANETIEREG